MVQGVRGGTMGLGAAEELLKGNLDGGFALTNRRCQMRSGTARNGFLLSIPLDQIAHIKAVHMTSPALLILGIVLALMGAGILVFVHLTAAMLVGVVLLAIAVGCFIGFTRAGTQEIEIATASTRMHVRVRGAHTTEILDAIDAARHAYLALQGHPPMRGVPALLVPDLSPPPWKTTPPTKSR